MSMFIFWDTPSRCKPRRFDVARSQIICFSKDAAFSCQTKKAIKISAAPISSKIAAINKVGLREKISVESSKVEVMPSSGKEKFQHYATAAVGTSAVHYFRNGV